MREVAGGGAGLATWPPLASVSPPVRGTIKPPATRALRVTGTWAEKGGGKWLPCESFLGPEPGSPAVSGAQRTPRTSWNPPAPELLGTRLGEGLVLAGPTAPLESQFFCTSGPQCSDIWTWDTQGSGDWWLQVLEAWETQGGPCP